MPVKSKFKKASFSTSDMEITSAPAIFSSAELKPTDEQAHAIEQFKKGNTLVIEALAGTGKTSTLVLMSEAMPNRKGQYCAFNRALVDDSKGKFGTNVACNTAHSVAFRAVGKRFAHRLNGDRMRLSDLATRLHIKGMSINTGGKYSKVLPAWRLAAIVQEAITTFCQSADLEPDVRHFPYIEGIDMPIAGQKTYINNRIVARTLLPAAQMLWADQQNPNGGLSYGHHSYLKLFSLSNPKIDSDYILLDEAQDTAPVLLSILTQQKHAQLIFVGDAQQEIYAWAGACNAMEKFPSENKAVLTTSFRFGQGIADVANSILEQLPTKLRLKGAGPISKIGPLNKPKAVLSRTNALAVQGVLQSRGKGHLVGGAQDIIALSEEMENLKKGLKSNHRELICFDNWTELKEYTDSEAGSDLKLMVKLVERFGGDKIAAGLRSMPSEGQAETVFSTAHKSKGRQWESVQLQEDFNLASADEDGVPKPPSDSEKRLRYVAVTRAQKELDATALFGGEDESSH